MSNWQDIKGRVFDIERYATQDGPGIRTVIFFKGCPLRCLWCANPESTSFKSEIMYYRSHCSGCNKCVDVCPVKAISVSEQYGLITDASTCTACGLCERSCFYNARKLSGKAISAGDVMHTVLKDKMFYNTSGGGVTVSGGEPFAQPDFLEAILRLSAQNDIHTAVETSGHPCGSVSDDLLKLTDLMLLDVKHVDPVKLRQQTGADSAAIMENIRRISVVHSNIIYRIPCIPGFNHTAQEMHEILAFIRTLGNGHSRVEILPYHRLGRDKYKSLGREYLLEDTAQLDQTALALYVEDGKKMGLVVSAGSQLSSGCAIV